MEVRIDRLHWREFRKLVPDRISTAILPVGILEAHAESALGTDILIPEKLAGMVAARVGALVAPTIPYGVPGGLDGYPGTVGVRPDTFVDYVQETMHGLATSGFKAIFVLNGHGGNNDSLKLAAQTVFQATGTFVAVIHWWLEAADLTKEIYGGAGGHGGADETGIMLAIDPELVRTKPEGGEAPAWQVRPSVVAYPVPSTLLVYGADAAPISLDEEKAKTFLARVAGRIEELIEDIESRWSEI
jgi:creatinine amidohydrolase